MTTSTDQLRRNLAAKYPHFQLPDVLAAEQPDIPPDITPSPDQIRTQFAAAPAPIKQIIKDAHTAGLIDGLRDVTIYASPEEAAAAWDALPGYVELSPKYPPRK